MGGRGLGDRVAEDGGVVLRRLFICGGGGVGGVGGLGGGGGGEGGGGGDSATWSPRTGIREAAFLAQLVVHC